MGLRTLSLGERTTRRQSERPRGTRLRDRFELLVPIGSGGFGTVWESFDMLLERPVAIKELVLDEQLTDFSDALREARATARLNHPAIVSLYEVIDERGRIYMVNELVRGFTLEEMIDRRELSDNDIGRIGFALCEALGHAHGQGVVHRDVKPANVMVNQAWLEGSGGWRLQPAKLMDFGIASIVDPGDHGGSVAAGPHAGSRGYTAPEQEAGHPATTASDVWALALVLFEGFTGTRPGRGRARRLSRVRRDLPPDLSWMLDGCLDPDPALRPDVAELAAALHAALPELSHQIAAPRLGTRLRSLFGAARGGPAERAPEPTAAAPRRRPQEEEFVRDFEPWSERLQRPVLAAAAAGVAAATMLAAGVAVSWLPLLACAVVVFAMPRAGWTLCMTAGAIVLATDGQIGSAMFLVPPAALAAVSAIVALPVVLDRALTAAGTFVWLVAVQAMSGTALVLSLPPGFDAVEDARRYADVALHSIGTFMTAPYAASLALWALAGGLLGLSLTAELRVWGKIALASAFAAAQIVLGAALGLAVPTGTIIFVAALLVAALALTWSARSVARVFSRPAGDAGRRVSA